MPIALLHHWRTLAYVSFPLPTMQRPLEAAEQVVVVVCMTAIASIISYTLSFAVNFVISHTDIAYHLGFFETLVFVLPITFMYYILQEK